MVLLGDAAAWLRRGRRTPELAPRSAVLLACLALADGGVVSHDVLADSMWGDRLPASWRPALRNVVADLRAALRAIDAHGLLRTVGDGYRLDLAEGSRVDVLGLERAAAEAEREIAAGRHDEAWAVAAPWVEPATKAVVPIANGEWVERLRERVWRLRKTVAYAAGRAALELGRPGDAERMARVVIEANPLREDAHQLLINALIARGNRAAAVTAYESLIELLWTELGSRPSAETQSVVRELLADRAPNDPRLDDVQPIAHWRRTVTYGLRVARAAFDAGEYEDVVAITERTVAALDAAGDPDPAARWELIALLAGAQRALGDDAAFATLDRALGLARQLADPARLADTLLAFTHAGAAADEHYVDHFLAAAYEEALAGLAVDDRHRRALVLGHLAVARAYELGGARVSTIVDEALAAASGADDDDSTLLDTVVLARRALWGRFDVETQDTLESRILDLAARVDDPSSVASALLWRYMTRIEQGLGEDLDSVVDRSERAVAGLRMGHFHHTLAYSRAALAILRGDFSAGEQLVDEAELVGRRRGIAEPITEALRLTQLVGLRHEQSRVDEIRDEAVAMFGGAGQPLWLSMVAVVEAAVGNVDAGAVALDGFLTAYFRRGPTLLAPIGLAAFVADAVARIGDRRWALRLYRHLTPHTGRGCYFAYFAGPVDHHLGVLAAALDAPEDAARHFAAAVGFAEHLGAPHWVERSRRALRG